VGKKLSHAKLWTHHPHDLRKSEQKWAKAFFLTSVQQNRRGVQRLLRLETIESGADA
jgi:hypothetical protein